MTSETKLIYLNGINLYNMRRKRAKSKRIISFILALVLVLSIVPALVLNLKLGEKFGVGRLFPSFASYTGEESGFSYSYNGDGTLTITGYTESDTEVLIPYEISGKTVMNIGKMFSMIRPQVKFL